LKIIQGKLNLRRWLTAAVASALALTMLLTGLPPFAQNKVSAAEPVFPSIASGYSHSLALKNDGTVWTWGNNSDGQLGDGTTTGHNTPVQVSDLTDVIAIAGGAYHSLALKNNGTVWAWGLSCSVRF
jgi:alpha-tubulin suppressor-like RCC1 family protein